MGQRMILSVSIAILSMIASGCSALEQQEQDRPRPLPHYIEADISELLAAKDAASARRRIVQARFNGYDVSGLEWRVNDVEVGLTGEREIAAKGIFTHQRRGNLRRALKACDAVARIDELFRPDIADDVTNQCQRIREKRAAATARARAKAKAEARAKAEAQARQDKSRQEMEAIIQWRQNPAPLYTPQTGSRLDSLDTTRPVQVRGYHRADGTYVRPHTRSAPGRQ